MAVLNKLLSNDSVMAFTLEERYLLLSVLRYALNLQKFRGSQEKIFSLIKSFGNSVQHNLFVSSDCDLRLDFMCDIMFLSDDEVIENYKIPLSSSVPLKELVYNVLCNYIQNFSFYVNPKIVVNPLVETLPF